MNSKTILSLLMAGSLCVFSCGEDTPAEIPNTPEVGNVKTPEVKPSLSEEEIAALKEEKKEAMEKIAEESKDKVAQGLKDFKDPKNKKSLREMATNGALKATILSTIYKAEKFSEFAKLLDRGDVDPDWFVAQPVTVFIPTNKALKSNSSYLKSFSGSKKETNSLIQNHIVHEKLSYKDITRLDKVMSMSKRTYKLKEERNSVFTLGGVTFLPTGGKEDQGFSIIIIEDIFK